MKIGIMLRHFEQHNGGVKNYTSNLLEELLKQGSNHEFVLLYNNPKLIGTYNHLNNVKEISIKIPSRFLWDQLGMYLLQKKEKFDVIFNPKHSVPLFVKCPTIFVCHGLNSYLMPWGSKKLDALYRKYIYPFYVSKSTLILAVSNSTKEHLMNFLNVTKEKVYTTYLGIGKIFREPIDLNEQKRIKAKYKLPDKFFLFVSQIYPAKNFGRLLKAFAKVGPQNGFKLVIAGEPRWLVKKEISLIEKLKISEWVVSAGWISHNELKYFYSLAEALVLPSLYEACPSPILEAMASGCPVITSNRYGTKELAANAGILVDPESVDSIANAMKSIIDNELLYKKCVERGFERVKDFSWEKCASETLEAIEKVKGIKKTAISNIIFPNVNKKYKHLKINPPEKELEEIL